MADQLTHALIQELKSKNGDVRHHAAVSLRRSVLRASLSLPSDSFSAYMDQLNRRIFDLINSSDINEKMGGVEIIQQLIEGGFEENETKIIRFAHYLRMIFQHTYASSSSGSSGGSSGSGSGSGGSSGSSSSLLGSSPSSTDRFEKDALEYRLLQSASAALGHLARVGGTLAADIVEFQIKQSLEWLEGDRSEQRRYAAVLVLKELAENTPTLFNVHVDPFLHHIWNPIRDPKLFIREAAIAALRACLNLISKRALRLRSQRYGQIYAEVLKSFNMHPAAHAGSPSSSPPSSSSSLSAASVESMHGGLLILHELLRHSGDFMLPRYREVLDLLIKYKDYTLPLRQEKPIDPSWHHHSPAFQAIYGTHSRIVRDCVLMLLPKMAAFHTDAFVKGGYLEVCMGHILNHLRVALQISNQGAASASAAASAVSKEIAFLALGELCKLVRERILPELGAIIGLVREGLRKNFCPQALTCLASLSCALGVRLLPYLTSDLIELMFARGLSSTLVESLTLLCRYLPTTPIGPPPTPLPASAPTVEQLLTLIQDKLLTCIATILISTANNPTSAALLPGAGTVVVSAASAAEAARHKLDRGNSLTLAGFLSGPGASFAPSAFQAASSSSAASISERSELSSSPFDLLFLSLHTLASFPFTSHSLLLLVRDLRLLDILDYSHPKLRRMAAITCARIIAKTKGSVELQQAQQLAQADKQTTAGPTPPPVPAHNGWGSFTGGVASAATVASPSSLLSSATSRLSIATSTPPPLPSPTSQHSPLPASAAVAPSSPSPVLLSASLSLPLYSPAQVSLIQQVLERLLVVALTDPEQEIRRDVLDCINQGSADNGAEGEIEMEDGEDEEGGEDGPPSADPAWTSAACATSCARHRLDAFLLSSPSLLHQLFMVLNDESFSVRRSCMTILGRLALKSPGLLMPSLRKTLIQLLTEVQHGGDARQREESCLLLGHLIHSAQALMVPYVDTILQVLIPKLRGLGGTGATRSGGAPNAHMDAEHMVASCILEAIGKLSMIGGHIFTRSYGQENEGQQADYTLSSSYPSSSRPSSPLPRSYLSDLLPILLSILQDKSSRIPPSTVLRTLNQLVAATGYVVDPYFQYPTLLQTLLTMLRNARHAGAQRRTEESSSKGGGVPSSPSSSSGVSFSSPSRLRSRQQAPAGYVIRREVIKLLGVLGALDPLIYKQLLEGMADSHKSSGEMTIGKAVQAAKAEAAGALHPSLTSSLSKLSDDYYPTIAIHALLRILRDSSLSAHHNKVIQSIMFILRSLGSSPSKLARFLPLIVPAFLQVMKMPVSGGSSGANNAGASGTEGRGTAGRSKSVSGSAAPSPPSGDSSLRDSLFIQLGRLISIVRLHIKPYLPAIFDLIQHSWAEVTGIGVRAAGAGGVGKGTIKKGTLVPHASPSSAPSLSAPVSSSSTAPSQHVSEIWTTHILILLEKIVLALRDEFKVYLPSLLPHMLHLLHTDRSFEKHITIKILHTFNIINQQFFHNSSSGSSSAHRATTTTPASSHGASSSSSPHASLSTDYLYLIIPSFIRLAEHPDSNLVVKQSAIASLASIARIVNIHEFASRILLPLARMLEIPDMSASHKGKEQGSNMPTGQAANTAALMASTLAAITNAPSTKKPAELLSLLHPATLAPLREDILQLLCILIFQFQHNFLHYVPLFQRIFNTPGWVDKNLGLNSGSANKETASSGTRTMPYCEAMAAAFQQPYSYQPLPPITHSYYERWELLVAKLTAFQRILPADLDGVKLGLRAFTGFGLSGLAAGVMQGALTFGINVTAMGGPHLVAGLAAVGGGTSTGGGTTASGSKEKEGGMLVSGSPGTLSSSDDPFGADSFDSDSGFSDGVGGGGAGLKKLNVSQPNLKKAWEVSQRSTKEDWIEWMRSFSIELLKESPSPALRACSILAQKYPALARELFHAAFVSCWSELSDQYQDDLIRCLESCFHAPNLPPELLQILLNLAEFMERDGQPLPLDPRTLGKLAQSVHAYAKALHYEERCFVDNPAASTESLISINNQLGNPEAAIGILIYTKKNEQAGGEVQLKESWYEKLNRWEDALEAYERKQIEEPQAIEYTLGRMRCLKALGEWERLHTLSEQTWSRLQLDTASAPASPTSAGVSARSPSLRVLSTEEEQLCREVAPLGAMAAWNLGAWQSMQHYLPGLEEGRADTGLLRAVISLQNGDVPAALRWIERTRELLDTELVALMGESYQRAYRVMVQVQQLSELEEIIRYKQFQSLHPSGSSLSSPPPVLSSTPTLIRSMWSKRLLHGVARNVDVWQSILLVRRIVVDPREDMESWLKFSALCRKNGRLALSLQVLTHMLGFNPHTLPPLDDKGEARSIVLSSSSGRHLPLDFPAVSYAYLKHLWAASGDGNLAMKVEALQRMQKLIAQLNEYTEKGEQAQWGWGESSNEPETHRSSNSMSGITAGMLDFGPVEGEDAPRAASSSSSSSPSSSFDPLRSPYHLSNLSASSLSRLKARIYLKLGLWHLSLTSFNEATSQAKQTKKRHSVTFVARIPAEAAATPAAAAALPTSPTSATSGLNDENIPMILQHFKRATEEMEQVEAMQNGTSANSATKRGMQPSSPGPQSPRSPSSPPPGLHELWSFPRPSPAASSSSGAASSPSSDSASASVSNRRLYKVQHNWAVMNFRLVQHYKQKKQELLDAYKQRSPTTTSPAASRSKRLTPNGLDLSTPRPSPPTDPEVVAELAALDRKIRAHVIPAILGFFRSISLAGDAHSLQDILRLLTLWFSHGMHGDVSAVLSDGFHGGLLSIDTWLTVIPQIIARIDSRHQPIRQLIFSLLCKIGLQHAQALVYPLAVVAKSTSRLRKQSAVAVLRSIQLHSPVLVEQSLMVSRELIRVAVLWHEMWHEALEEASRLWFGQRNFEGMRATIAPLRQMMERGATTLREIAFVQCFGRDFQEAFEWMDKYEQTPDGGNDSDLNQAWDILVGCFRKINKQLTHLSELELQYVSPTLLHAHSLQLAMPGTFLADRDCPDRSSVLISYFTPSMKVIESKQRPRRISIMGSDGLEYTFLLKGHEDLRQDKRVMQLFGLVNNLLEHDRDTSKKDLKIPCYSVIPLAPTSGLIKWLDGCDTMHALIKSYRDARNILLNIEHRLMLQMAPDHSLLTIMQKVEVFEYALARTTGQDLAKVLWLRANTSEQWLDRRTNYTRSLAVMCMVGYILGLGDRHPSNLMLHSASGKLLHIDFGDCFEVAMQREKFPERVPFRLTRMLVNAMEVSGIEGTFRCTADAVMRVLRENKESVMAVLEAFVYDPLINWRLVATNKQAMHGEQETKATEGAAQAAADPVATAIEPAAGEVPTGAAAAAAAVSGVAAVPTNPITSNSVPVGTALLSEDAPNLDSDSSEVLNAKAVSVISRVEAKLQGRDFEQTRVLDTSEQVEQLIQQATSHINLSQAYIGWCPFW